MKILSIDELLTSACRPLGQDAANSAAEIAAQLKVLADWQFEDQCISRSYTFKNYYQTLAFVNAIAWMIHRQDHHPELTVTYNRCTVRFNTHSAVGITQNDFICAARCDALYVVNT